MCCKVVRSLLVVVVGSLAVLCALGCRDRPKPPAPIPEHGPPVIETAHEHRPPAPGAKTDPEPESPLLRVKVKCAECAGKGQIPAACRKCEGRGFCHRCKGLQDQDCAPCGGRGGIDGRRCVTCAGIGFYRCQVCFGSGICGECAGKRMGPPATCVTCSGKGEAEELRPAAGAAKDTWVEIGNGPSGFYALMPAHPVHTGREEPDGSLHASHELKVGATTYFVGVVLFPKPIRKEIAEAFDPAQFYALVPDSKVLERKRIGTGDVVANECKIALPDGQVMWLRDYQIRDRMYLVSVQGPKDATAGRDAVRFMGSFKLLNP